MNAPPQKKIMNYLQNLGTTSTRPGVERPGEGEEASDELLGPG